jgi:hypothetical protein
MASMVDLLKALSEMGKAEAFPIVSTRGITSMVRAQGITRACGRETAMAAEVSRQLLELGLERGMGSGSDRAGPTHLKAPRTPGQNGCGDGEFWWYGDGDGAGIGADEASSVRMGASYQPGGDGYGDGRDYRLNARSEP